MRVRRAERNDLPAIAAIAHASALRPLGDLLPEGTRAGARADTVSPSALKRVLLSGSLLVCCEDELVTGFAAYELHDDHLHLGSFGHAAGDHPTVAALMHAIRRLHPSLPISIDVVLGHLDDEHLHESIGFVPGETVAIEMAGHPLVGRRWWLAPSVQVAQPA